VRKAHRTAIGTGCQIMRLQGIVRAAHIAAALRMFALWMWGHCSFSLIMYGRGHPVPTFF
jgi:hypothetical protein